MAKTGKTGVSSSTPKNIMFGAGTIHKNLTYTPNNEYVLTTDTKFVGGKTYYTRSGSSAPYTYTATTQNVGGTVTASTYYERKGAWNFNDSIIGATQGGSKLTIKPEFVSIEADGKLVETKGLRVKVGETATMEVNFLETTKEIIKASIIGADGTSTDTSYDLIESKASISDGDYFDNIAFVGTNLEGKNMIVIMENALCTSGFESDGKNKEAGVVTCTFECHAELTSDLDSLPYHIYYPKSSV